MNKNLKKLGLLVVTAIAMAMGVNSASALKVGNTNVTTELEILDSEVVGVGNTVTVSRVNGSYRITLNGNFNAKIEIDNGEYVTVDLNGYTLSGDIDNYSHLTLVGTTANSRMTGALRNLSNGYITINGGNYSTVNYTPNGVSLKVETVYGTLVSSLMKEKATIDTTLAQFVAKDAYYEVVVAPANIYELKTALETGIVDVCQKAANYFAAEGTYTKASFAAYKEAYANAKALIDEHTPENPIPATRQTEIKDAYDAYIAAVNGLEELGHYDRLKNAVKAAETKLNSRDDWTNSSVAALKEALAAVDYDLPVSKDSEIAAMREAIEKATFELVSRADYSDVDALEALIDSIGKDSFTSESWAVYEFAQDFDRDLPYTQQTDVDKYYAKLYAAAKGLKLAEKTGSTVTPGDDEPVNPGTSDPTTPGTTTPGTTDPSTTEGGNNNSGTTVNPNTGATGTTSDVNTSDNAAVYAVMNIASLIALAGCGLVLRKQN